MEVQEMRVLRRKIHLMAKAMADSDTFLTDCVTQGLLTKEQLHDLTVGGVSNGLPSK